MTQNAHVKQPRTAAANHSIVRFSHAILPMGFHLYVSLNI
jgi:hypothetical protein